MKHEKRAQTHSVKRKEKNKKGKKEEASKDKKGKKKTKAVKTKWIDRIDEDINHEGVQVPEKNTSEEVNTKDKSVQKKGKDQLET